MTAETETGKIKTMVADRNFAFIRPANNDHPDDLFLHSSEMKAGEDFGKLREGDRVEFVRVHDPKGWRAEQCRLVDRE